MMRGTADVGSVRSAYSSTAGGRKQKRGEKREMEGEGGRNMVRLVKTETQQHP
jgi:hypothetical protein